MADDSNMTPALDDASRLQAKGENAFVIVGDGDDLATPQGAEDAVRAYLGRLNDFKRDVILHPEASKKAADFVASEAETEAKRFLDVGGAADNVRAFYRLTEGSDLEVLEAAFTRLSSEYLNLVAADEAGQLTEDEARFRLDALVTEAICALLGLPMDDTPPEDRTA